MGTYLGQTMAQVVADYQAAQAECAAAEKNLQQAENRDRDARKRCHALACLSQNLADYLRVMAENDGAGMELPVPM